MVDNDANAIGHGGRKQSKLSDPHAELPVKNFKYVKNCVELYLAHRDIEEIARFDDFVNLEVLWLNNNHIDKLEGLDKCFRIKEVYAHSNRIRSLQGSSLVHFKFLQTLRLNDNNLGDFASTLTILAKLRRLEDLDLYGNPIEEEDNYRLHVIRAVPSLLVLDRHVITQEERARAGRLRDEPILARGSDQPKHRRKHETIAGAPPQSMSGTVKMLFKEVEKIEREQEAARKEALVQELRRMDQQQQLLTRSVASSIGARGAAAFVNGGLDSWEMAALEKQFRSLEEKPTGGLHIDQIVLLVVYLADRGFVVTRDGKTITQEDIVGEHKSHSPAPAALAELSAVFPLATVQWQEFQLSLETRQLECHRMSSDQLTRRADAYFARAAVSQKRLTAATSDDTRARLMRESHEAAHHAYHLAALVDGKDRTVDQPKPLEKGTAAPLRSRYFVTTFARDQKNTPKFYDLKEQSARVSVELSAKYRLDRKDFQKYLVKQAPPASTLERRQLNL